MLRIRFGSLSISTMTLSAALVAGCASTPEGDESSAASEAPAEEASDDAAPADEAAPAEQPAAAAPAVPPEDHLLFKGYDAFNDGNYELAADMMFTDDATWQSSSLPGKPFEGKAGIQAAFEAWTPLSPAAGAKRVFMFDDMMIAEGVITGRHVGEWRGNAPTNKQFGQAFAHVIWFDDAQHVTKLLAVSNGLAIPVQLGVVKSPRPFAPVKMPLDDTELVAGPGVESRVAAYQKMLDSWHKGEATDMASMLADDVVVRNRHLGTETVGKDAAVAAEKRVMAAFTGGSSDYTLKAVGDYVVGWGTHTATHSGDMGPMKATNKTLTWTEVTVLKFDGDKVVEVDRYLDPMEMQMQMQAGAKTSAR